MEAYALQVRGPKYLRQVYVNDHEYRKAMEDLAAFARLVEVLAPAHSIPMQSYP